MSEILNKRLRKLSNSLNETLYSMRHMSNRRYRLIYQTILFSTTAITTISYMAYNSLFLHKYQSIVQMYADGSPAPLNEKLELLALRVWNEAHVARKYKLLNMVTFFPSIGCEPFSAGSLEARTGAIIGLPHNFTYETIDDVKTADMQFFGQHDPLMKWRSEAGKQLLESFVLSEKAKKFAIAREIHITNTFRFHANTLNIMISSIISIALGQEFINKLNIPRNLKLRLVIRIISLAIGVSIWYFLDDIFKSNWSLSADELAVGQGEDYFEGALQYYDKMRKRNAALYQLLQKGQSKFTPEGDVKGVFGFIAFDINKRLEHLKQLKSKNQKSDQKEENTESNDN